MTTTPPLTAVISTWHDAMGPLDSAIGVGIDLVEVESVRRLINAGGESFLNTAWSRRELREANGQAEGLAGKWAAKEAVMKALQHGIGELDPLDVEILTTDLGAPRVHLHRRARAFAQSRKIATWHLSLTHDGGWAAAIAVASPRHLSTINELATTQQKRNRG